MDKLVIASPAKINIGLNVVSKRDDGFHNIETIFYPIELYDEISIKKSDHFNFISDNPNIKLDEDNLIIKAKNEIENYVNKKIDVEIELNKKIPIGAGLGGGSSDAASTLMGLNKLLDLNISHIELKKIALKLGSDVPFFLNPVPCFAEARGEVIYPINFTIKDLLLIVNPKIHISTKWAFNQIVPDKPVISLKSFIENKKIKTDDLFRIASNDFEEIVFSNYSTIKKIKAFLLDSGAYFSMMTGTGSTVFGIFKDEEAAHQAELYLSCQNYFTYIQSVT